MSCPETPEVVAGYFDEQLSARRRRELDAHLAGCEHCRREIAELEPLRPVLGAWREEAVPEWDRHRALREHRSRVPMPGWWQWAPLVASLVLVLAVVMNARLESTEDGFSISFTGPWRGETGAPGAGDLRSSYLAGQGMVIEMNVPPGASEQDAVLQSLNASLQNLDTRLEEVRGELPAPVRRPDAGSIRETMTLSLARSEVPADDPSGEQPPEEARAFEARLFAALCNDGIALEALPDGEHLNIVLRGPGTGESEDRVHVLAKSELLLCRRGELSPGDLQQQARSYSF